MHARSAAICFISFLALGIQGEDDVQPGSLPGRPTKCEVCKFFVRELEERLLESGKTHDVLNIQYNPFDDADGNKKEKKKKYRDSELRLVEAIYEPPICEEILKYNVHAEKEGSYRYAKGMSTTMQTLHGLKDKGVKVELGMPYEMWDKTHAEVALMQKQCEIIREKYEDEIEDWYFKHQDMPLMDYFCKNMYLKDVKESTDCLYEVEKPESGKKGDTGSDKKPKTKKKKKSSKVKDSGNKAKNEAEEKTETKKGDSKDEL